MIVFLVNINPSLARGKVYSFRRDNGKRSDFRSNLVSIQLQCSINNNQIWEKQSSTVNRFQSFLCIKKKNIKHIVNALLAFAASNQNTPRQIIYTYTAHIKIVTTPKATGDEPNDT